jgi:transcription elongation GreA/GreB family factor
MAEILATKKLLLNACLNFVNQTEATVLQTIASHKNDLLSETKSSSGDKHETGRAMIQLEMEKASQQLLVVNEMKNMLKKIAIENSSEIVKLGSLIKTTKGTYFLAISAGKITIENTAYFAVSTHSPIGKQLLGKKTGDFIPFNNANILEIH